MTTAAPPDVVRYVAELSAVLADARPDLVGVYLHGSAVLGGFRSQRSDVDVLAILAKPGTRAAQQALGQAIANTAKRCPGTGLEMSVITAATAANIGCCSFEVHIHASATDITVIPGAGQDGDADLILHCAVCREHALAVRGPPAAEVFGPVPAHRVAAAMLSDLRWASHHAKTTYAVLNACRALRFNEERQLCSKLDGGQWYLSRHGTEPAVIGAIAHQRDEGAGPATSDATAFVTAVCDQLLASR